MDRYDRDERPSIFPQSDEEFDDAWAASSESTSPDVDPADEATWRPVEARTAWSSPGPVEGPIRTPSD